LKLFSKLFSFQLLLKRAPFNGMRGKKAAFTGMRGKREEEPYLGDKTENQV
jgi:hypothetical protein